MNVVQALLERDADPGTDAETPAPDLCNTPDEPAPLENAPSAAPKPSATVEVLILPGGTDQDPKFAILVHGLSHGPGSPHLPKRWEDQWGEFADDCGAQAILVTTTRLDVM